MRALGSKTKLERKAATTNWFQSGGSKVTVCEKHKDLLLRVKAECNKSVHNVRTLFLEHHVNPCEQLTTDSAQNCAVMLTFGAFAFIESL